MHITWGGILYLLFIGAVILGIILIRRWRSGGSISLKGSSLKSITKRQKPNEDTILCLNVYRDKIVGEYMLKKSVCPDATMWELGTKKYILQGNSNNKWIPVDLPSIIAYPTERLARMMDCPLTKLKSLKFKWYEHLAPFAPVAALLIAAILFIVVL